MLIRLVNAVEEPLSLLFLRDVQEELENQGAVAHQVPLELVDIVVSSIITEAVGRGRLRFGTFRAAGVNRLSRSKNRLVRDGPSERENPAVGAGSRMKSAEKLGRSKLKRRHTTARQPQPRTTRRTAKDGIR